ncbi:TrmH family RNA methyltransferase [Acidaminobacter hydrogenoformans]|uniref:RNA methyltransferase, TrmH family n=1 Tax=Acidaminobacter hydrogenoformans DSM 2784 TaxID=1120920 RepID=A0A1G5RVV8_9FIRM|nr:RNA methyltransferase [Acidaminobacter hydrogenoformans]SCZ77571.1 RNA methyltransferase, TrmH family [Acidaminobacter hydrogenoformans DSM 2784]
MKHISSSQNEAYKSIKSLLSKKHRTQQGAFLIEGVRLVRHVLERGWPLQNLILDLRESDRPELSRLSEQAEAAGVSVMILEGELFDVLSETVHSQGCLGVAKMPELQPRPLEGNLILALDQIRDPGNLGTILRTADAAGVGGVLLSKGCVEPFNEKVVRATMGSLFDVPLVQCADFAGELSSYREKGYEIAAAVLENSIDYAVFDWTKPTVLVVGNEAEGISEEIQTLSTQRVSIPIRGGAESLNAAVAAGVLLFEGARQQRVK